MPKAIIDDLTSLPISRQRRYQLRKRRDRKCIRCGQRAVNRGYFCETHRQVNNVAARELQRARFDLARRYHDSESYGFSYSSGRMVSSVANTYLEEGRSTPSPAKKYDHLRVALLIGFTAIEAYLKLVAAEFQMPSSRRSAPLESQVEYLFKKLSTVPLDEGSICWQEFRSAMKLRDELQRPRTRSRLNVDIAERALNSIWSLLNTLNSGIYGSRWA
jgi:hypothetical protein